MEKSEIKDTTQLKKACCTISLNDKETASLPAAGAVEEGPILYPQHNAWQLEKPILGKCEFYPKYRPGKHTLHDIECS